MSTADELRQQILDLAETYHAAAFPPAEFIPGLSTVSVSGKVLGVPELRNLLDASLDLWLTEGRYADALEHRLTELVGVRHAHLCNSGSSANLLAVAALCSPRLGDRRLVPGDEVLTVAAGFPTTVNPILLNGLVPVFVDVTLGTYDVDVEQLAAAVGPRTRAIALAHTLGNPFDLDAVQALAKAHDLFLVEDNCDALGARYRGRSTGSFGHLATQSFYPAHQITTGEGGCVLTDSGPLAKVVESLRDWGRDCWCPTGAENTCGKRFSWELGDLPAGYDHKYIYSHIGYNLKITDPAAAVGLAQMDRLAGFVEARRENWSRMHEGLADLEEHFIRHEATPHSEPSWFGYALTIRPGAPFSRVELLRRLDEERIGTRLLFGGNLVRQPAYLDATFRVASPLTSSDTIAEQTFWVGVHPGLDASMLDHTLDVLHEFVRSR